MHAGRGLCTHCYQRFRSMGRLHEWAPLVRRPLRPPSSGVSHVHRPIAVRLCGWRPDSAECRTLNCYRT